MATALSADSLKITFLKKPSTALADTEKVSLWDDFSGGTLSIQDGQIRLAGTWRISAIGNFLGSGLLGILLIRPFFQKQRQENVLPENIDRIIVKTKKSGNIYHLFQSRDAGVSEVHVFSAGARTADAALEQILTACISKDRYRTIA